MLYLLFDVEQYLRAKQDWTFRSGISDYFLLPLFCLSNCFEWASPIVNQCHTLNGSLIYPCDDLYIWELTFWSSVPWTTLQIHGWNSPK